MGSSPARITAADFVTPPEFREYGIAAHGAGRIGGVRVELVHAETGTRFGACYQQVPLRVLPPFQFAADQPALLYLLNPTAGLMDGDAQLVELTAGAGSQAAVVGQSATRIHPCLHGFCTQQWAVRVEPGAVLVVLPGPAIPFAASRYYQRVSIDLAEGAGLVWGDVWLAGRYARGALSEQFRFAALVQDLTVRRAGRLVYRDRFAWSGPWDSDGARWHFGDGLAVGSLFATGPVPLDAPDADACFQTAAGDGCLRFRGTSESVTGRLVGAALRAAAALGGKGIPAPWLLGGHDLAPNHWFT